jgi:very-short-patch-repair endonuclease
MGASAARRKEKLMKAQSASTSVQLARRLGFARAMRREPTASESALWAELSGSKLGVGFRRQAVVAGCIVDFLAPSRKLVVEVDGSYHRTAARRRADARRDQRLQRAGFRVLRLSAELVLGNIAEAVRLVAAALG